MYVLDDRTRRDEITGAGLLAHSVLRSCRSLCDVPRPAWLAFTSLLQTLPPSSAGFDRRSRFGRWIEIAAALEATGHFNLAADIILAVMARVPPSARRRTLHHAFLSARLGRIHRQLGDTQNAEMWYQEALRISRTLSADDAWTDAIPHALLGLCILNQGRGNYPAARRFAMRVLRAETPTLYAVQAHQIMALIERKLGAPKISLRYLWKAQRMLPAEDVRHQEILIMLAEAARELSHYGAAVRARVAVLAVSRTPRIAAAALSGLLKLAAMPVPPNADWFAVNFENSAWAERVNRTARERSPRQCLMAATRQWLSAPDQLGFSPYDQTIMLAGLVELALSDSELRHTCPPWIGDTLETMRELTHRFDFFEHQFDAERLSKQYTARLASRSLRGAGEQDDVLVSSVASDWSLPGDASPQRTDASTVVIDQTFDRTLRLARFDEHFRPRALLK